MISTSGIGRSYKYVKFIREDINAKTITLET